MIDHPPGPAGRYYLEEARAQAEPKVNPSRTGVAVFADDFKTIRTAGTRTSGINWRSSRRHSP